MAEGNGRRSITSGTLVPIGFAALAFGAGWGSCWQIHDRMAATKTDAPSHSIVRREDAPDFWTLQTDGFKRSEDELRAIRQQLVRIEALIERR